MSVKCPFCNEEIEKEFIACPFCEKEIPKCKNCGKILKSIYKICPYCKTPVGESKQARGQSTTVGDVSSIVKTSGNGDIEVVYGTKITKIGAEPVTCPICEVTFTGEYFKCPRCKRDHIHEKHQVVSPDYYEDHKLICQECYEEVEKEHRNQIIEGFINDGNQALSEGKFHEAIQYYEKAIQNGADESVLSSNIEDCNEKLRMEIEELRREIEERAKDTDIWKAVENDDVELVKYYIENGFYINEIDKEGNSLLHISAYANTPNVAKTIIMNGADIEQLDRYRFTPLLICSCYNSVEVCEVLLDNGADIEGEACDDYVPLLMAAEKKNIEMVEYLLNRGANIDAVGFDGFGVLEMASFEQFDQEQKEYVELFKLLLSYGAKEKKMGYVIARTTNENFTEVLEYLLKNDINPNINITACENSGILHDGTPLHIAVEKLSIDLVRILINYGADKNLRNKYGMTPLDIAKKMRPYISPKHKIDEIIKILRG